MDENDNANKNHNDSDRTITMAGRFGVAQVVVGVLRVLPSRLIAFLFAARFALLPAGGALGAEAGAPPPDPLPRLPLPLGLFFPLPPFNGQLRAKWPGLGHFLQTFRARCASPSLSYVAHPSGLSSMASHP